MAHLKFSSLENRIVFDADVAPMLQNFQNKNDFFSEDHENVSVYSHNQICSLTDERFVSSEVKDPETKERKDSINSSLQEYWEPLQELISRQEFFLKFFKRMITGDRMESVLNSLFFCSTFALLPEIARFWNLFQENSSTSEMLSEKYFPTEPESPVFLDPALEKSYDKNVTSYNMCMKLSVWNSKAYSLLPKTNKNEG